MAARIRREPDTLVIVLERDGEEPATRRASDGDQALLFAITTLIECRRLRLGDRLIVQADE